MKDPILASLSPNEHNTPDRVADFDAALKSFGEQFRRISDDAQQPADIMLHWRSRYIHIEVKEAKDLWASKQGHLGDQLVKLLDGDHEAFVIVLENFDKARAMVPRMTTVRGRKYHATSDRMESNQTSLRALNADAMGVEIPVFYLSSDRVLSFQEALSYAKARLFGGNPFQWCTPHRGKARKVLALTGNRIGEKNAKALLDHFGSLAAISSASFEELKKVPGIGSERAISIMELMH